MSFKYFTKHWKKKNRFVVFHALIIPFFSTCDTLDFIHSAGKIPLFKQDLKIISNGL